MQKGLKLVKLQLEYRYYRETKNVYQWDIYLEESEHKDVFWGIF